MNKKIIIIIAVVLVAVLALVLGLGVKKEAAPAENAAPAVESVENVEAVESANEASEESAVAAEKEEESAKETQEPVTGNNPMTEEFIKENTSVGVVEGSGIERGEDAEGFVPTPPQVNIPVEDDSNDEPVVLTVDIADITYDMYVAMSAGEQQAVMESFGSTEDFMRWLNYIKAAYEADHPAIEVGPGGVVDLG